MSCDHKNEKMTSDCTHLCHCFFRYHVWSCSSLTPKRERERERDDRNERAWETQKILFPRTFKHSYKIIRWYYTGYKWWERTCVENTSSFATVKRTEHVGWDRVHSRALSNEISIRFFLFSHDNEVEVKYFTERPYICNEYDERTFDMWSDSLKS